MADLELVVVYEPVDVASVFDVAISPGAVGRVRVEVVISAAGQAWEESVSLDVAGLYQRRAEVQRELLAERAIASSDEPVIREIGRQLFIALLGTGAVARRYASSQDLAIKDGRLLRVLIRTGSPQLAALPWEAMYDDSLGDYVCRRHEVVRHVPVPAAHGPLEVRPPLRILAVAAVPRGLGVLDVGRERELLEKAFASASAAGLVELHWARSGIWDDLQAELLRGPWHVIHYIGHGEFDPVRGEGVLDLESARDSGVDPVASSRLVSLLRVAKPVIPRLVVLNSCSGAAAGPDDRFSSIAASLIRGGVNAVAAMQYQITDPAAIGFARGFYTALACGRGVDEAVSSGRVAILGTGDSLEWVTPALYLRGDQARLYNIHSPYLASFGDGTGFSGEIRERYANDLAMAGLDVPDQWDLAALDRVQRDCQHKTLDEDATIGRRRAADLLKALCLAAAALSVLRAIDDQVISTRKLRQLYLRHVGNRPDADTLEGMLILAAQAGISERRCRMSDSGDQDTTPSALARFLLGIAGYLKGPDIVTLDDVGLAGLAELVTGTGAHQLRQEPDDVAGYLATKVRRRTWALIELDAPDYPDARVRTWPTAVFVHVVPERGSTESQRFPCTAASQAGVEEALRQAVDWLPEGDVYVDLCLPRNWLEAGVEHWDVVEMGGLYESLARNFQPRLRWSMHWRHPRLRDRQRERFGNVDWQADPVDLQEGVTHDPASFSDWLNARELPGAAQPPYFTGCSLRTPDHDPLGALLREGYGLVAWFNAQTPDGVRHDAARIATGLNTRKRREDLPDLLAAKLKAHRPIIIWSDPDGRAGFALPPPRQASVRRRNVQ